MPNSGAASSMIQYRFANIVMFINYQPIQFLKKLIMMMIWNWLRHWCQLHEKFEENSWDDEYKTTFPHVETN
jgi:hypothetical protein